jgi:hypothetical protein
MPDPSYPFRLDGSGRTMFRRVYTDPLGQPMKGAVVLTATQRIDADLAVTPLGASATKDLVDGVLEVYLQPGYYQLKATLTTADGHTLTAEDKIAVTG